MSEGGHEQAADAAASAGEEKAEDGSVTVHAPLWRVPPIEYRFKKGQSGNPAGRKKKRKEEAREPWRPVGSDQPTRRMILEEAYRKVKVRDGAREVKVPTNRAVFRAMANSAIGGNRIAQHLWTQIVRQVEREQAEEHDRDIGAMIDYKKHWEEVLREKGPRGLPPGQLPHPDDVYVNPRTGQGEIRGPMTAEEQKRLDTAIQLRAACQANFTQCETALETATDEAERAALMAQMAEWRDFYFVWDTEAPPRLRVALVEREDEGWDEDGA
jgi:hypothetical protein